MAPTRTAKSKPSLQQTTLNMGQKSGPKATPTSGPSPSQSKTKSKSKPNRVETDVVLAIQPQHLDNIVKRKKDHEFRRYRLKDGIERLWFYETRGEGKQEGRAAITHIALTPPNFRAEPGQVPLKPLPNPENSPGIGNDDFNKGLKQSKFGYQILSLYELKKPLSFREMKDRFGMSLPMGWYYVGEKMWKEIWENSHHQEAAAEEEEENDDNDGDAGSKQQDSEDSDSEDVNGKKAGGSKEKNNKLRKLF